MGTDQDTQSALQTLVQFTQLAQRRGAYSLEEAAAVWKAVQCFMVPPNQPSNEATSNSSSNEFFNDEE